MSIIEKCKRRSGSKTLLHAAKGGSYSLFYFRAVLYWFKVLTRPPIMQEDGVQKPTGEMKELSFSKEVQRDAALAILASNLFALNYVVWSSCQVVNSPDLMFPVDVEKLAADSGDKVSELATLLIKDVEARSRIQTRKYTARGREFVMRKQYYYFKESKPIVDNIDAVLAGYYGFTAEELDFVINYDIKYRLGRDAESNGDE